MRLIRLAVGVLTAALLVMPATATAATGTINDPTGDQVVESGDGYSDGIDVGTVTIKNGPKAITITLGFNDEYSDPEDESTWPFARTTVLMKWGAGARNKCTFGYFIVGPAGRCHNEMPPLNACGSIDDGYEQVIRIPRRCVRKAEDTLRFKTISVYQETVCSGCDELTRTVDSTVWSPRIKRG